MYIFLLVLAGGKINRPGQLAPPPGGEDNQGGGASYPRSACPPEGKPTAVGLSLGGGGGGKLSRGQDKLGHWQVLMQ